MESTRYTVTLDEFKLFHRIDRTVYLILTRDLARNPVESLYILALWMWLERGGGFSNFISKTLSLPPFLVNELADEAVTCLKCLNVQFPFISEASEIPLTQSLVERDISLQFFFEKRFTAFEEIQILVSRVCVPSLSDIMQAHRQVAAPSPSHVQMHAPPPPPPPAAVDDSLAHSFFSMRIGSDDPGPSRGRGRPNDRTMFVTFSKGYPVTETEVRQFFTMLLGNCIESLHMQEVGRNEQALYAKIVFFRASFIRSILSGASKAKFNINGKHVWMRKFVPKNNE
ncbi:hypothetical protein ABFS82_10G081900 [Erythranthe guttata]|uniref:RRM domain-containing protein n=1 Tax=Erythranthe guttata TaxID=4155 RepID=A0A022QF00_ERYGU|nr:PREDICTED: uncharacterized protein LOC105970957 [Erythranthe guttata]XP_012851251.1 PREDICTED: uncharacterized protein LOC105970957 [Erythranthe guttata]XP_012851252.1 PREDICTED: uncharacterized protein LOC105970957 [Erythranthe guttata]EYU25853.1 hypothetical protein MIMGU_mgv1a011386mg [Erythranthe guttata]|eukprot:XP_012851250.1 PREDICTED: uncharacterized protein LOC105970957 [Erythranthe guttata]